MPGVFSAAAVSARVCVPALRRVGMRTGQDPKPVALQILPQADLHHQRHGFSQLSSVASADDLGDVPVRQRQTWLLGGVLLSVW